MVISENLRPVFGVSKRFEGLKYSKKVQLLSNDRAIQKYEIPEQKSNWQSRYVLLRRVTAYI
jgi:hypothetical protein